METKQKFTKIRPGLGKNHWEKQLLAQHRTEAVKYLITANYCFEDRKILMSEYDRKIKLENIIQIHSHYMGYFFDRLCTGNITDLIDSTTSKNY